MRARMSVYGQTAALRRGRNGEAPCAAESGGRAGVMFNVPQCRHVRAIV